MPQQADLARDRIARVFRFLQAFHQVRNPVPRAVSEQWHMWLDSAPATQFTWVANVSEAESDSEQSPHDDPGLVLRVRRPKLTNCPIPPAVLDGWLQEGWRDPEQSARVIAERPVAPGDARRESFEHSVARIEALKRWDTQRSAWCTAELPARRADQLFQTLYALHGQLRRESERFELVLGDGNLVWQRADGDAHYPVVLQTVQLEFDPDRPEFRITETDNEVELYTALLNCFEEVDARRVAECRDEVVKAGIHPLLGQVTNGFLKRLAATMSGRGTFAGDVKPELAEYPQFYRRPVLFLRPRTVGFARVLEGILADIEGGGYLPASLTRIVGVDHAKEGDERASSVSRSEVLLSKQANPEQVHIVQRLHDHGSVLVQGPPGTGKSHTIANLIGHLLAHGKSVLVTSHTTKALNVLRGHVVDELRPLCVSILENDVESRRQLEQAVTNIADRLARSDRQKLVADAKVLESERARILRLLDDSRVALREARSDEQRELVVSGSRWSPCEAARLVAEGTKAHSWIPGAVEPGAPLPLTPAEVDELYRLNGALSRTDEQHLSEPLPDPEAFMVPAAFEMLLGQMNSAPRHQDVGELWSQTANATDPEAVDAVGKRLVAEATAIINSPEWQQDTVLAGMASSGATQPWEALANLIDEAAKVDAEAAELLVRFDVALPEQMMPDEIERVASELCAHVEQRGTVNFLARLTNRTWAAFLKQASVSGARPRTTDHFRALIAAATLARLRGDIERRWKRLMEPGGAPKWVELGRRPEIGCSQFSGEIRRLLTYKASRIDPELERLRSVGFNTDAFLESQPPMTGERAGLLRLTRALASALPSVVTGRVEAANRCRHKAEKQRLLSALRSGPKAGSRLQARLAEAVAAGDATSYRRVFEQVIALRSLQGTVARRKELLKKIHVAAPAWAEAIRARSAPHDQTKAPGDPVHAWVWTQLHAELERRASKSLPELQARMERLEQQLRDVTVKLIDRRAWSEQLKRTSLPQQQALVGWLDLVRRIGKGTGKRAPILRAEAAKQMRECRTAVPVWIMPLARVAEMFDGGSKFDVVIIDEASQSDVMGLVALYLGANVVVVGDHEQVSPTAVGQQLDRVSRLIEQHLEGVPNSALYDGKTSIYDLARQSFGGLICLTEHFRCYPDIIEFSNWLSYQGRIKPLREPFEATVRPFVIPYRVEGATRDEKVNAVEAAHVAALLVGCASQPEYADKTFGVVSLLGDEQAVEVDKLVRQHLSESEYVRRRVLCGNAANFQGDERDVMFLSLVYAPDGGPLSLLTEAMYQQRFNVAASRARDQMWVVYSLDPSLDLKPKDLRRRLIEHALDPLARTREVERKAPRTESDFERKVLERLVARGYRVIPQYSVGAYRIDFVVEGRGGRLAVECDGEQFHTLENLDEDMARQSILERLGWKFVRIRGSLFYRDPDRAMLPVFQRLAELGIEPGLPEATQNPKTDLQTRVVARAAELLREWRGDTDPSIPAPAGAVERGAPASAEVPPHVTPDSGESPHGRTATVIEMPFKRPGGGSAPQPDLRTQGNWATVDLGRRTTIPKPRGPEESPAPGSRPDGALSVPLIRANDSANRKTSFLQVLAKHLPPPATCPICAAPVALRISNYGPYLPCTKRGCGGKHNVELDAVKTAVSAFAIKCDCGGTFALRKGRSTFLGCDRYPTCERTIWWRDL